MIKKGELLSFINHSYMSSIKLVSNSAIKVASKVILEVANKHGMKKMKDFYHTLDMGHSLLSVRKIMEKNYKLIF